MCDWLIHPSTTLSCDLIYCRLLALSCVIQSTAAFLHFLVWSNLLSPSCALLCDPIYCRLLALSCVIQSTAAFLRFLVWSNLLPPSCPIHCQWPHDWRLFWGFIISTQIDQNTIFFIKKRSESLNFEKLQEYSHTSQKACLALKDVSYWPDLINYYIKKKIKKKLNTIT